MDVIELAHRICWRYKHSNDPHHSSTYTFNDRTLMQFSETIRAEVLEEAAKWCDDYAAECAANENWEAEDVSLINAAAIRGLK